MTIFILVCIILGIRLYFDYFIFNHHGIFNSNLSHSVVTKPNVSIIVCSKNNVQGLITLIPTILNQNYPIFEVIVVDDFSIDTTQDFIKTISDSRIRLITPDKDVPGKKHALTCGIKEANNEWILVTDSDCFAMSDLWIDTMISNTSEKDVILGYSPYEHHHSILNDFIRFETAMTAIQYMSFSLNGCNYMGVGRNMAFKKTIYEKVNGFQSHEHILSGDDDLFIQQIQDIATIGICIDEKSFMKSASLKKWKDFFNQKSRHISTSSSYQLKSQILLLFLSFARIMPWALLILGFLVGMNVFISVALAILVYFMISSSIMKKLFQKFDIKDLWYKYVWLDFIMFVYYLMLVPKLIIKQSKWN